MSESTAPWVGPEQEVGPERAPGRVPADPPAARRARTVARVLLAVAVGCAVLALLLELRVPAGHRVRIGLDATWTAGVPGVLLAAAGAVVAARRPGNRLALVLGVLGLWWALDEVAAAWLALATASEPALPGASAAFFVFQRLGAGLLVGVPLVLALFPDGHWPRGRLRWLAVASVAASGALVLVLLTIPSEVAQRASGAGAMPAPLAALALDPLALPLPDDLYEGAFLVARLLVPLALLPALVLVVLRHRRASGRVRAQGRWLLWAAVVDLLVMVVVTVVPGLGTIGVTVVVAVTAAAVVVAVVEPDVVDVDRLLVDTLVVAVPVVVTVLVDLAVLGGASWLLGDRVQQREVLVVAVVVTVAAWLPLRTRLARVLGRLLGGRQDPYDVVAGLARGLEHSRGAEAELAEVARAVARAVRVRWVGVEVGYGDGRTVLVEHGDRPDATRALPVTYRGEAIGRLLLPARGVPGRLRAAEERLLADVVRQAAAAVRTSLLADELQRSREDIVTAVEEERRRLRRDLHDGLGPMLAAVASRIDTARIQARKDPAAADEVLVRARADVTGMLTEVRRLVHGLRPPALDEVGLVGAVERLARDASPTTAVLVRSEGDLVGLPAAVEVAAYRIVAEALTNVARHAGAAEAHVRLAPGSEGLVVEVVDDGVGIPAGTPAGVGLVALRERAAELGGRCEVSDASPGTRVRAVLPLGPGVGARSVVPVAEVTG
ncbi:hypothetical protein KC207_11540 [Phycicoccus sp. BSK3Z-2]|uniref:Histidine kinase/HSP90-like ATPase domain-containing protein n=1 Tax=Phycicoccus avicenniae TaxID=2828860 RepID=A0A941D883_9MICO|nr:histidine kinase [Phycicoccus avicenniae]MBR7743924.1 hypothetical protein [Phycicoccus avicenniae]